MPIRKYSSVEEMPGVGRLPPLDPDNWRIACELTELAFALHPWHLEPGVHKFASAAEASAARREREVAALRRERSAAPYSST
jgi:hypothetical protein